MKIIIINENSDSIELVKGVLTEVRILVGNGINVNLQKDNPVPSIDNFDEEFNDLIMTKYKDTGVSWHTYKEFLKSKLQNGVETDNEQPKKDYWTIEFPDDIEEKIENPEFNSQDLAYKYAKKVMGGDEDKKDWKNVLFTHNIWVKEEIIEGYYENDSFTY